MPNYKELVIYAVIAVIVVVAALFMAGNGIFSSSYNVRVKLGSVGNASYPYQTSHFYINITNNGSSPVLDLRVGFYVDGQQISTNSISIPAGRSVILLRNYTYSAPGSYDFEAVADPGRVLQIKDRQEAQSSITENIIKASTADPYSSIPNSNITSTQTFTMSGSGALASAAIAERYNISMFDHLFGPGGELPLRINENLYGYIAYANGAFAEYSDNTVAYADWLQGTISPQIIDYIVSSFRLPVQRTSSNYSYIRINNKTSMCIFYSNGWTKMVSYFNNSGSTTCLNIISKNYSSTQSGVFVGLLRNNSNLTHYQSLFTYTNSTSFGTIIAYSSNNLTATNLFQNKFGVFSTSIRKTSNAINITAKNFTCNGLIYNHTNAHVCSYLISSSNGSINLPYGLINSTSITPHYMLNVYSLVNDSELIPAHENAAHLIAALNISENSAVWRTVFKNSCSIANQSINCKFNSINQLNNVSINLTNGLSSSLRINSILCQQGGGAPNLTIGSTILPNSILTINMHCYRIPVPSSSIVINYLLTLNYTYNNATKIATGILNISNQQID